MIWLHSQLRSGLFMWRNWKWGIIILAVAWAIAGGVLGRELAVRHGLAKAIKTYERCLATPTHHAESCQKAFRDRSRNNEQRPHWVASATVGLSPIAIVWLLVWGAMALVRLIRRGPPSS
jgi:hypothetical protein